MQNPLLAAWTSPYGLPPFAATAPSTSRRLLRPRLPNIAPNWTRSPATPEPATFANTVAAFDRAGWKFARFGEMFWNLSAAHTNAALEAVERELAPKIAMHQSAVYMHAGAVCAD